jgi:hypothetical protein
MADWNFVESGIFDSMAPYADIGQRALGPGVGSFLFDFQIFCIAYFTTAPPAWNTTTALGSRITNIGRSALVPKRNFSVRRVKVLLERDKRVGSRFFNLVTGKARKSPQVRWRLGLCTTTRNGKFPDE